MSLEQDHQLKEAKENPQKFDSMFQIDLKKFENSNEFRESLKIQDIFIDQVEAVSIGWLFVLLAELAIAFVGLMHYATALFKRNIKSGF